MNLSDVCLQGKEVLMLMNLGVLFNFFVAFVDIFALLTPEEGFGLGFFSSCLARKSLFTDSFGSRVGWTLVNKTQFLPSPLFFPQQGANSWHVLKLKEES